MTERRMPTICYYSVATHLGGAERSLLELLDAIVARGDYRPWVVLPRSEGPLIEALRDRGIEIEILAMPERILGTSRAAWFRSAVDAFTGLPELIAYLKAFEALVKARQPALIHTTGIKCHALAALVQRRLGVPVVWHLRDILEGSAIRCLLRALAAHGVADIIANSEATARAYQKLGGVQVIHNGLDPQSYPPGRSDHYRKEFGIPDSATVVGIVGAIARWKGQADFLEMAAQLIASGRNAWFLVIGSEIYDTRAEGGALAELEQMVHERKISNHVRFVGFERDAARAIRGLDVLVHASRKPEPFGRVVLEAMASGVPVVAAGAGGILELIEHEEHGLLFRPNDVQGLACAVERLIDLPDLRVALALRARLRFLSHFSMDAHSRQILGVYDRVLAAERGHA